uniref:CSON015404 protein n=2 Tax=Culicoides sonorensis TaxID=179676 RepID=A0A336K358_CULSO
MAQGSFNYMDDIPITFSEKWKIPPLPSISNDCIERFFETPVMLKQQSLSYEFNLEKKVLEKVEEWKIARSCEINERDLRIKIRQEERRKLLEAEGTKLKEQLTQVSYPSPDEFCNSDSDNEISENKENQVIAKETLNNFNSILTPTVVNKISPNEITANDLDTLSRVSMSKTPGNVWKYKKNDSHLELADFENDSSDPFYSMELKTIDDLDILAQVLKTSVTIHSKVKNNMNSNDTNTCSTDENGDTCVEKANKENIQKEPIINSSVKELVGPMAVPNGYSAKPYVAVTPQYTNCSSYQPTLYSHFNQQFYPQSSYYATGNMILPDTYNNATCSSPYDLLTMDYKHQVQSNQINDLISESPLIDSKNKLRSKSVPDIVKELEHELKDNEQRRIRNNSQCQEENRKRQEKANEIEKQIEHSNKKNCDDLYLKNLPKHLQNLALKISNMGFPLDRVCRIAQQVQGDDKKIIEHLIPLTELLDLGFEEKNVSDALLKFDNNKEKALEFLISQKILNIIITIIWEKDFNSSFAFSLNGFVKLRTSLLLRVLLRTSDNAFKNIDDVMRFGVVLFEDDEEEDPSTFGVSVKLRWEILAKELDEFGPLAKTCPSACAN